MKEPQNTILIVDDEEALQEIFAGWVNSMGLGKVLTASNGLEALEVLKDHDVTLLITDVRMPQMDGVTLVKQLSELGKIPSIVFVSGFSDVNEREMYELGAESFLVKPLRKEDLTGAIERALAKRSELWRDAPGQPSRQSILVGHPNGGVDSGIRHFQVGQGGFCARYSQSIALGKVDFVCHLDDGHSELRGSGVVRWRSHAEGLIGIEFTYLDEASRAYVIAKIAASSPHCYIPSNIEGT